MITIGAIHGGIRNNIIPDEVKMHGTVRSLTKIFAPTFARVENTCCAIAKSGGHMRKSTRRAAASPSMTNC